MPAEVVGPRRATVKQAILNRKGNVLEKAKLGISEVVRGMRM
jgi:hypothetical protein